jgi:hypothetical protein
MCGKLDIALARSVARMLRTLGLSSEAFSLGPRWQGDNRRLDEILQRATHFVAVYTNSSVRSSWLSFLAGYSLGSDRVMVLYRPSRTPFQAPFLAPFFLILSLDDLSAFMETERNEWASVSERREARRELLELGISFRGDSCAEAVSEGNLHGVELFIRAGFSPDTRDKKGVPILCLAARTGHRGILNLLLSAGASIDMQSEDRGNTALMDAAAGGYVQIVEDLLGLGADVSLKSKNGQSALIISVGRNDLSISALLLAAGADPDDQDKLGFSARKYAALFHNPAMVALCQGNSG